MRAMGQHVGCLNWRGAGGRMVFMAQHVGRIKGQVVEIFLLLLQKVLIDTARWGIEKAG